MQYLSKPVAQNKSYVATVSEFTWCAWNECPSHEHVLEGFDTVGR